MPNVRPLRGAARLTSDVERARIAAAAVAAYRAAGLTPEIRTKVKALREELRKASADLGKATHHAGIRPADVLPDLRELAGQVEALSERMHEIVRDVESARTN